MYFFHFSSSSPGNSFKNYFRYAFGYSGYLCFFLRFPRLFSEISSVITFGISSSMRLVVLPAILLKSLLTILLKIPSAAIILRFPFVIPMRSSDNFLMKSSEMLSKGNPPKVSLGISSANLLL